MSGAGAGIAGNQGQSSFAALELLADPTRLQAKIDSLKAAEDSAREQIELAGPASEILSIRAEIEAHVTEAAAQEQHARDECERLIAEAGDASREIRNNAKEQVAKEVAEAESRNAGAKLALEKAEGAMASVEREKQALQVREDELGDAEATLQQKAEELVSREHELTGEKARLAEVRDAITAVL